MKKFSNKTKDIIFFLFWIFIIACAIFGVGVAVGKCFAENEKILDEYFSRPVIIRAYTEEDEKCSRICDKFKAEGYEVGY